METINNLTTAASKLVFGEQQTQPTTTTSNETQGSEPVSGMQGKGTPTEPFDQGNAENPAEPAGKADISNPITSSTPGASENTNASEPFKSSSTDLGEKTGPNDPFKTSTPGTGDTSSASNLLPTSKPETTGGSGPTHISSDIPTAVAPSVEKKNESPMNPSNAATGGEPRPLENTEGTGVTGASAQKYKPMGGDVIPSNADSNPGAAPTSAEVPEQKQQGADRPKEAPSGEETDAIKSKKDDAEEALKKRDPNDHSGEPMHMHGAGDVPNTQEERRESKVGMPGGQEHGKEPKGTGEQWVKSSGLHADGGDFDATKPGAGKEADRLLEQKGIHKDASGAMDGTPPSTGAGGEHKEKVPLGEKIKSKLHIGHKDK